MKPYFLSWKYLKVVIPLAMVLVPIVVLINSSNQICIQTVGCVFHWDFFALGAVLFCFGLFYMANNHEKQIFGVDAK